MSHLRAALPLGAFLSACLLAAVHAQTPACDTLAVASDPVTSDSLYPPTLADVRIPSSGARMNGVLYLAQGKGPHTTVLVLHGFPGTEKNADLAQDMVNPATEWQLERYAHVLAGKRVLLVAATRDAVVPLGEVYEPLGAALRQEGARHLTAATLDADHGFSNSRVRLARLLVRW